MISWHASASLLSRCRCSVKGNIILDIRTYTISEQSHISSQIHKKQARRARVRDILPEQSTPHSLQDSILGSSGAPTADISGRLPQSTTPPHMSALDRGQGMAPTFVQCLYTKLRYYSFRRDSALECTRSQVCPRAWSQRPNIPAWRRSTA